MEFDLSKPFNYYFNEISKIPRGSYNEQGISDALVQFAKQHGLDYQQDEIHNVVIYKAGSQGLENSVPVILQAHIDMVAEKTLDSKHDFTKDPLDLYVDNGRLRARGTTLGADDGKGVAYMMAILADDSLVHPPLECAFTVQEEIGLVGSMKINPNWFQGKRFISLDAGGENTTISSCAGGLITTVEASMETQASANPAYSLLVTGLKGGHSGTEIGLGGGNSNKLLGRILHELNRHQAGVELVSLAGGEKDNAIPRDSQALFCSGLAYETLNDHVKAITADILAELAGGDDGFTTRFERIDDPQNSVSATDSKKVIDFIFLCPSGVLQRDPRFAGFVISSANAAVLKMTANNTLAITISIRSQTDSAMFHTESMIQTLADLYGYALNSRNYYPGWSFSPVSPMRDTYERVLKEQFGMELVIRGSHGGTECGVFNRHIPGLDLISIGCLSGSHHSPNEWLDLASFAKTYSIVTSVLAALD